MKIIENNSDVPGWFSRLCNWLAIDSDRVRSIGFASGFWLGGKWRWKPLRTGNASLFYNGVFFLRLSLPFGIFVGIRWSDNPARRRQFFQGGIGWKLNGRPAFLGRCQCDASAAKGVTGPNYGQAQGFEYGTH